MRRGRHPNRAGNRTPDAGRCHKRSGRSLGKPAGSGPWKRSERPIATAVGPYRAGSESCFEAGLHHGSRAEDLPLTSRILNTDIAPCRPRQPGPSRGPAGLKLKDQLAVEQKVAVAGPSRQETNLIPGLAPVGFEAERQLAIGLLNLGLAGGLVAHPPDSRGAAVAGRSWVWTTGRGPEPSAKCSPAASEDMPHTGSNQDNPAQGDSRE